MSPRRTIAGLRSPDDRLLGDNGKVGHADSIASWHHGSRGWPGSGPVAGVGPRGHSQPHALGDRLPVRHGDARGLTHPDGHSLGHGSDAHLDAGGAATTGRAGSGPDPDGALDLRCRHHVTGPTSARTPSAARPPGSRTASLIEVYYRVGTGSWRGLTSGRTAGGEFAITKPCGATAPSPSSPPPVGRRAPADAVVSNTVTVTVGDSRVIFNQPVAEIDALKDPRLSGSIVPGPVGRDRSTSSVLRDGQFRQDRRDADRCERSLRA